MIEQTKTNERQFEECLGILSVIVPKKFDYKYEIQDR